MNVVQLLLTLFTILKTFFRRGKVIFETYVDPALTITKVLKELLISKPIEDLTQLIPGDWDDNLRLKLITILSNTIKGFELAEVAKIKDPVEKLNAFVAWLQTQPQAVQESLLQRIASTIVSNLANIKQAHADMLVSSYYSSTKQDVIELKAEKKTTAKK